MGNIPIIKNFTQQQAPGLEKFVICIHGFSSNKNGVKIAILMRELAKQNIGVVAIDLPGHGENKTKLTIDNCIKDISDVETSLRRYNKPISLYGSSFGGYVVMAYLLHSTKSYDEVLLIAPVVDAHKMYSKIEKETQNGIFISPELIKSMARHNVIDNAKSLKDLKIIYAEKDITVENNEILTLADLVSAELFEIKGAGHWFDGRGELDKLIKIALTIYNETKKN